MLKSSRDNRAERSASSSQSKMRSVRRRGAASRNARLRRPSIPIRSSSSKCSPTNASYPRAVLLVFSPVSPRCEPCRPGRLSLEWTRSESREVPLEKPRPSRSRCPRWSRFLVLANLAAKLMSMVPPLSSTLSRERSPRFIPELRSWKSGAARITIAPGDDSPSTNAQRRARGSISPSIWPTFIDEIGALKQSSVMVSSAYSMSACHSKFLLIRARWGNTLLVLSEAFTTSSGLRSTRTASQKSEGWNRIPNCQEVGDLLQASFGGDPCNRLQRDRSAVFAESPNRRTNNSWLNALAVTLSFLVKQRSDETWKDRLPARHDRTNLVFGPRRQRLLEQHFKPVVNSFEARPFRA